MANFSTYAPTAGAPCRFGRRAAGLLFGAAVTCLGSVPAFAQAAHPSPPAPEEETAEQSESGEIVVTANRFEQSLQRLPQSISALGGDALEAGGVEELGDLNGLVPSLQIGSNGQVGSADIGIRGISTRNVNAYSGAPTVAVHMDGVYVPRPVALQQAMFDINRVEVLRGPQGTLYGRNATAGVINIITRRPTQEFEFQGALGYGNYDALEASAIVNLPATDRLAFRGAVLIRRNDGLIDTLGTTADRGNQAQQAGFRASALWRPLDGVSWLVTLEGFRDRGTPNVPFAVAVPGTIYPVANGYGPWRRPLTPAHNPALEVDSLNLRSNLSWEVASGLTATYLAGFGSLETYFFTDLDGLPAFGVTSAFYDENTSQSHEANITYVSGNLQAVVGANYSKETGSGTNVIETAATQLQFPHLDFRQSSYGLFTQVTYSLSPSFRVTGGLRYSHDKASNDGSGQLICPIGTAPFALVSQCSRYTAYNERPNDWSNVSWRAGFDYDVTDTSMFYATVSTGYKQGQLNRGVFPEVQPELVTSYEAGMHNRLFGRSLTLNLSAYYMDYTNLQVAQVVVTGPNTTQTVTVNAAEASIYGFEAEAALRIARHTRLDGSLTYLHARYDKFSGTTDPIVDPQNRNPLDLSGNDLVRTPRWSGRLGVEHDFLLGDGAKLTLGGSLSFSSSYYLREFNRAWDRQKSYTQTDLRLAYTTADGRYGLEGYVRNLEDRAVMLAAYAAPPYLSATYNTPRQFGVRARFTY